MALALGAAFDENPEFFSNLQNRYDLALAKQPDPNVKRRATLQSKYPLRDMMKRGWIQECDTSLMEMQIARFYESDSVAHAAKKTNYDAVPPAQLAWLFRVRQLARTISPVAYSEQRLRELLPKLRAMTIEPEAVADVAAMLLECGVTFVLVEVIGNAKIDGVCLWIDDRPVIGMSLRLDRLDNFWFVLRHEIEHVLRGDGKDHAIIDELDSAEGETLEACEIAANTAAAEFCMPVDRLNSFIARKGQFVSERDIVGLAGVVGTHPALVVGQWQRKTGKYQNFRKYLVNVRKHLINERSKALLDGWGHVAAVNL